MAAEMNAQIASQFQPRVNRTTFQGVMWGGVSVAFVFLCIRFISRWRTYRHFYSDDWVALIAWLFLLSSSAIWTATIEGVYDIYDLPLEIALGQAPSQEQLSMISVAFKALVPSTMFYYLGLWSIKISFLLFFRRLQRNVTRHRVWWWIVFVFVIVTLATVIGTMGYGCLLGPLEYIFTECNSESALHFQLATLRYVLAVDVATDVMIISIPTILLWNVQMSFKRKASFIALFSMTVVVIIVAVIRVALTGDSQRNSDPIWLYLWSNVEISVSIIISCLVSFRQLFVRRENEDEQGNHRHPQKASTFHRGLLSLFTRIRSGNTGHVTPVGNGRRLNLAGFTANSVTENRTITTANVIHMESSVAIVSKHAKDSDESLPGS